MNTPILKAKKGNFEMEFYNDGEYEEWKAENDTKGWTIKYYKGLGTSTGKEFREYFANKKIVGFEHSGKNAMMQSIWSSTRSVQTTARSGWRIMTESYIWTPIELLYRMMNLSTMSSSISPSMIATAVSRT
jgi:hypothetical protein